MLFAKRGWTGERSGFLRGVGRIVLALWLSTLGSHLLPRQEGLLDLGLLRRCGLHRILKNYGKTHTNELGLHFVK